MFLRSRPLRQSLTQDNLRVSLIALCFLTLVIFFLTLWHFHYSWWNVMCFCVTIYNKFLIL